MEEEEVEEQGGGGGRGGWKRSREEEDGGKTGVVQSYPPFTSPTWHRPHLNAIGRAQPRPAL